MAPDCDPDLTGFGRAGCLLQCWQPVGWLMCSTAEDTSPSVRLPGMGLALLQSRLVSSQMSPFLFLRQGCLDATYDQAPISVLSKKQTLPSIYSESLGPLGIGLWSAVPGPCHELSASFGPRQSRRPHLHVPVLSFSCRSLASGSGEPMCCGRASEALVSYSCGVSCRGIRD